MIRAIWLGLTQLFSGRVLGVIGACAMLSVGSFIGIWLGLNWLFTNVLDNSWELATVFGSVTTLVLAWFLFPVVAGTFLAMFLDKIATIVEEEHYPQLARAKGLPIAQSILVALRYLVVLVAANVLLLALLLFPPAYFAAWIVVNGWLVGREYFELVAMRRCPTKEADELRRRRGFECLVLGCVLAFLLTIPIVNLVLPIVGTAVMVHRFHDWRGGARD